MAKSKPNYSAWGLKFVGSLVYLYVLYQLWVPGTVSGPFGPVLFGAAAVSAVALFVTNLASLSMPKTEKATKWLASVGYVGGFTLLAGAYTVSPVVMADALLVEALIGFFLVYVGSGMDMRG